MRTLIYSMMVSLDGFIEGPSRELDWAIVDEELHRYINDQQRAIYTQLYGRRTYEVMVDHISGFVIRHAQGHIIQTVLNQAAPLVQGLI